VNTFQVNSPSSHYNENSIFNWENYRDLNKQSRQYGKISLFCAALGFISSLDFPFFFSIPAVFLAIKSFRSPKKFDTKSGDFMAITAIILAIISIAVYIKFN